MNINFATSSFKFDISTCHDLLAYYIFQLKAYFKTIIGFVLHDVQIQSSQLVMCNTFYIKNKYLKNYVLIYENFNYDFDLLFSHNVML